MPAIPDPQSAIPAPTNRVLVVDDEPDFRHLLAESLQAQGYQIIEAEDGEQALREIASQRPDVILLDLMLPQMDGAEVCRRLKADPATAPIPVLIITAATDRVDRLNGIAAGANDLLGKPLDPADLMLRVRNALQAKRLHDRLQRSYEQLQQLEQLRDSVLHMVVHDINGPLSAVLAALEMLRESPVAGDPVAGKRLQTAWRSVGMLKDMVAQLLDINRLEAGQRPLHKTNWDLAKVALAALDSLGALEEGRRPLLVAPESVLVACDFDVIRRVIANLVGNALKFAPGEGQISLAITRAGQMARVAVTDAGPGIPPEYHQRIFEKFRQVPSPCRRPGMGLGLAFCKLAVEAHGGRIGVISPARPVAEGGLGTADWGAGAAGDSAMRDPQSEGPGSTFWFELPVGAEAGPKSR